MLILASASPRRQELLRNARILFKLSPADIREEPIPGEPPRASAERLAREKAEHVYQRLRPAPGQPVLGADALTCVNTFVGLAIDLGADTVVIIDGEALGKPADEAEAARMLGRLSGRRHEVVTGVCLIGLPGPDADPAAPTIDVRSEVSQVTFRPVSDEAIEDYIATGEPMDKAGAYAIQGVASRWIPHIEGCYTNVVGLPVPLVCRMLRDRGTM